jgi:hypothetical protein
MALPKKCLKRLQSTRYGDNVLLKDLYQAINLLAAANTSGYYTYSGALSTFREVRVDLKNAIGRKLAIFRTLTRVGKDEKDKPQFSVSCSDEEGRLEFSFHKLSENDLIRTTKATSTIMLLLDMLMKHRLVYEEMHELLAELTKIQRKLATDEAKRAEIYENFRTT